MAGCLHAWAVALITATLTGPLIILAFVLALWCAGFTAAGVVGGSLAAVTQSGLPLVPAGSLFACLQSVGALGLHAFSPVVYAFCSTVCVALAMYAMWQEGCHISACPCHAHGAPPAHHAATGDVHSVYAAAALRKLL